MDLTEKNIFFAGMDGMGSCLLPEEGFLAQVGAPT